MKNSLRALKSFKNVPFTTKEAESLGVSRLDLSNLAQQNKIERITRGLYILKDADTSIETQFIEASKILGHPSAVCLESALIYHGLTDERPFETWMMVPETKKSTKEGIRLWRSYRPMWKVGIENKKHFSITNIERTVVDCIAHPTLVGQKTGVAALARYLSSKIGSRELILEIARDLGHEKKVREISKILSFADLRSI